VCHALHYSCNVNAAVADSLRCRMICGTVPSSVHAWMPPATAATWSPAAAHSKSLPRQWGRRDRRWSCATTVEHAVTVTMQTTDAGSWQWHYSGSSLPRLQHKCTTATSQKKQKCLVTITGSGNGNRKQNVLRTRVVIYYSSTRVLAAALVLLL